MARSGSDNVRAAWQFLIGKGLTPAQAAGVIGSMQGESGPGLNPGATNPNGGAYGIAQWLGGRKTALTKRADPGSLQTQLNYLWSELQGPESGSLKGLKAAHTPEGAAVAWQKLFERGAPFEQKYDQRAANARKVFDTLKGAGGGVQALMDASSGPKTAAAPSQGQDVGGGVDVAALLSAMGQQKPVIQSAGIAAPAFSARPSLPGGYASPQGGGGLAQSGPDVAQLLALVGAAGQGQGLPASQQAPATPAAPGAVAAGVGASGGRISPHARPGDPVVSSRQSVGGLHQTDGLPGYPAHDYFAPAGSHAVAPVSGTVVKLSGHDPAQGPPQGPGGPLGWSTYIRGNDGKTYFLTHMGSRDVKVGQKVQQGQVIGTVADYDKYGRPSHIHLGVSGR